MFDCKTSPQIPSSHFGLCGFSKLADFQQAHRQWVEIALWDELSVRDARWSEAVAVGSLAFVEKVKSELGIKALHRELEQIDGTYALRESGETGTLTGVKPGKYTLELRVVTFGSQR